MLGEKCYAKLIVLTVQQHGQALLPWVSAAQDLKPALWGALQNRSCTERYRYILMALHNLLLACGTYPADGSH